MRGKLRKTHIGSSLFYCFLISLIVSSCSPAKKVPYFQDIPAQVGPETTIKNAPFTEHTIRTSDVLAINIYTIDPQASEIFNKATPTVGTSGGEVAGFQVDKEGNIELPLVGKLRVEGMTTIEAKEAIKSAVKKFYVDPSVNVRLANFTITMLGDIRIPGKYTVSTEKLSILDALGLAGDLNITGRRENIMVIREMLNGEKKYARIDLRSATINQSEFFYLKSGDVIYIEPNKAAATAATVNRTSERFVQYALPVISITFSIIGFIRSLQ